MNSAMEDTFYKIHQPTAQLTPATPSWKFSEHLAKLLANKEKQKVKKQRENAYAVN